MCRSRSRSRSKSKSRSRSRDRTCKTSSFVGRFPGGTSCRLGPIRGLMVADLVVLAVGSDMEKTFTTAG